MLRNPEFCVSLRTALIGATCLAAAFGAPAVVHAAGASASSAATVEEVIVTATKRNETVQNVPFSINALTQEDIRRSNAVTLEDLSRNVAGLSIQNLGPGQSQVSVRGVSAGQVVRDQPGVKEQVGVYLDESVVSLSLFTPDLDLFDLNRMETLRGPQGTLFGSGNVGGTLRYITNQPSLAGYSGVVEADINQVSGGGTGGWIKGAVNMPLSPTLALRAVGYDTQYGGFIDALHRDGSIDKNVNSGQRYGGRLSLLWQPAPNISITPRIVYQRVNADGFNREEVFNLFANPFMSTPVTMDEREQFLMLPEAFNDRFTLADLTASIGMGSVNFTSVTSYVDRDILVSRDASALTGSVSVDLGYPNAAVLLPSNLVDTTALKQFTQEARFNSTGDGPWQWVVGGFYSHVDRTYHQRLPTPGYDVYTDARFGAGTSAAVANGFPADSPYNSDLPYTIKQTAFFGESSYRFGRLTATAGVRYYSFNEERQFKSGGLFSNDDNRTDKTSSSGFTPRFLLSYKASDTVTFNAQASKGFRLGGVNDPLNLPLCSAQDAAIFGGYQSYDDETLWNYEAGVKSRFGPMTFNAAVFRNNIKNLQTTLDAGSCSSRIVFNVPKAHSEGVEVELNTRLAEGWTVGLSGTILQAQFDSTVVDGTGAVIGGIRKGNRLPSVPNFEGALTTTYTKPINDHLDGFITASVQHVGSRYTQPSDQENNPRSFVSHLPFGGASGLGATVVDLQLPAYNLVNMNLGVSTHDGLDVTLWVNNLFDENALLSFDRERGGRARLGFEVGTPRTIGVTVRKSF